MGLTTTGQIVNLLANDVNHFDEVTPSPRDMAVIAYRAVLAFCVYFLQVILELHYLWVGPLQALVIITLLWYEVGLSCLAGLGAIVLMIPLQIWFGKLFGIFRYVIKK